MKFNDFTLLGGRIKSRRQHDTNKLVREAIDLAGHMLAQLRRGAEFVPHGLPDLPAFGVSLGPPDWLLEVGETVEAPGRFFCVGEAGKLVFQFNLLLPPSPVILTEVDDRAVATALGLSLFPNDSASRRAELGSEEALESRVREITQSRPVLATALIPTYFVNPDVVRVAADFSTCFAAALLLEDRS